MEERKPASRKRRAASHSGDEGTVTEPASPENGTVTPLKGSNRTNKKMKIEKSATIGSPSSPDSASAAPPVSKFTKKGKISINFEVEEDDTSKKLAFSTTATTTQPSSSPDKDEGKKKTKKKEKSEGKKEKKEKKKKGKDEEQTKASEEQQPDKGKNKKKKKTKKEKEDIKGTQTGEEEKVHELRRHEKKLDLSRSGKQEGANPVTNTIEVAQVKGLAPTVVRNLEQQFGITQFFPIQAQVIPVILRSVACGGRGVAVREEDGVSIGGDICVCAPTGSGKTLAYAVPIVNTLINRVVVRLRALVILPNRDLALQVKSVFDLLCEGTDLKVEIVVGQSSFRKDQEKLVRDSAKEEGAETDFSAAPTNDAGDTGSDSVNQPRGEPPVLRELVDILICTPELIRKTPRVGRLMDLLTQTRGFTLQHLRFLVIDEADRLLDQSFQDWLNKVLHATHSGTQGRVYGYVDEADQETHLRIDARTTRQLTSVRSVHLSSTAFHSIIPEEPEPLHKLLFSATLTNNPKKIAALRLNNPHFFSATSTGLYKMPEKLQEYMVICSLAYKPLVLLYLLEMFDFKRTLCFTSSVESTHRLYLLLTLMGQTGVAEYSSTLPQRKRTQIIEKFTKGDIKIVIASDAMSRGLDIEDVENVINYDVPPFIKTYVHRVGRTARAGRQGKTYTLLLKSEAHHFRAMLKKAEHSTKINQVNIDYATELTKYTERYQEALDKLKEILKPHLGKNDPTKRADRTKNNDPTPEAKPTKREQKKQKKNEDQPKRAEKEQQKDKDGARDQMEEEPAADDTNHDDADDEERLLALLKQRAARSWGL